MIEFQLIDDTEDVEVNLIDNTDNIEVELIKEIDRYPDLKDLPSINNVTLTGNKTLHELGIQPEGDYPTTTEFETRLAQKVDKVSGKGLSTNDYTTPEKNKLASLENYDDTEIRQLIDTKQPRGNYITSETDPTVPNHVKSITQNNIANWNNKQEQLISGTNIKTINNNSILGSGNIEIEGGGSDYPELTNKPKINDVELNGNKTSSDLGLQPAGNYALKSEIPTVPTNVSAFTNDAGYLTSHQDLTNYVTNTDYATYNVGGVVKISVGDHGLNMDNGTLKGVVKTLAQYNDMSSKGVVSKGTLENVITGKGLITNAVDDLVNYYKKSETFTKQEVNNLISAITTLDIQVVQTLPTEDISTTTIYLVPKTTAETNDAYDEYIYVSNAWEHIGSTEVDLTNYVTNTDYATSQKAGVIKCYNSDGLTTNKGTLITATKTYEQYNSGGNWMFIGKGTLENVIEGKGLATKSDMPKVFYGSCATGASTAAKVVVCEEFTEADLVAGTRITVLFTNANTYNGTATLNINGTGAKNIYYNGTTTNARYMWVAGESVDFIYNGTQWATINGGLATTSYYGVTKLMTSAGSDTQSYALTPRSLFYFANYSIAPYYSASKTYAVGDKVRYSYYIYECITAIDTPESWTAAHWEQIDTLQEQIDAINTTIGDIETLLSEV